MNLKRLYYALLVLVIGTIASCHNIGYEHKSAAKDITSFTIEGQVGDTTITNTDDPHDTITVIMPYGTALTSLAPTIEISELASVNPESGASQDFTHSVTYTVTAEDGTTKEYVVTTTAAQAHTVTYNGNGNTGGTAPTDSNNYAEGATVTVASVGSLVKAGNNFSGWNTVANGSGTAQAAASTFAMGTADVTLYAQWTPVAIGNAYQGGKVAYILQVGDPGYIPGETHGLIAAIADLGAGAEWGCFGTTTGATGTAIGTGRSNTTAIVNGCSTSGTAAKLCDAYTNTEAGTGVYGDWYLPSKNELDKLYINKVAIGGFVGGSVQYWSSSEFNPNAADFEDFGNGFQDATGKSNPYYVRAIRSF